MQKNRNDFYKNEIYSIDDFLYDIIDQYDVPLFDIYRYTQENEEYKNILDIFNFSTEREQQLCLTLLTMISVKYNRSIVMEFRKDNELLDKKYGVYVSRKAIDNDKTLLVAALMYNNKFANKAILLCAYMGRKVLDKAAEYISLVSQDGFNIKNVPDEYITDIKRITFTALKRSRDVFPLVKNRSFNICLLAVKRYSYQVMEELVLKGQLSSFTIKRAYKICKEAVERNGLSLKFVYHEKNRDVYQKFNEERQIELCRLAVSSDPMSLKYVPETPSLLTKELCLTAIEKNSRSSNYIPKDMLSDDMIKLIKEQEIKEDMKVDRKNIFLNNHDIEYAKNREKKTFDVFGCIPDISNAEVCLPVNIDNGKYPAVYKRTLLSKKTNKQIKKLNVKESTKFIFEEGSFIGTFIEEFDFEEMPKIIEDGSIDDSKVIDIFRNIKLNKGERLRIFYPDNNRNNAPEYKIEKKGKVKC